jgi:catechol 2,3-dioxygenase-like lactoylglutathione lyase family enzyme
MMVRRLEHYNIRTTKFVETVKFYADALGMKARRSPIAPEDGPTTWIYDDSGVAVIHLTPVDPADPLDSYAKQTQYRGGDPDAAFEGSGAIDHVAFECEGFDEIKARLTAMNVKFVENVFSGFLSQVFVKDPNGVTLELNFRYAAGATARSR